MVIITLAQLMMIAESPKIFNFGIPINRVICKRAHSAISSDLVLVQVPAQKANSNEWDSFRYKQNLTPPELLVAAPSKKP